MYTSFRLIFVLFSMNDLAVVYVHIDTDECASCPCMNSGTCIDEINGYWCACCSGYTGEICQTGTELLQYVFSKMIAEKFTGFENCIHVCTHTQYM